MMNLNEISHSTRNFGHCYYGNRMLHLQLHAIKWDALPRRIHANHASLTLTSRWVLSKANNSINDRCSPGPSQKLETYIPTPDDSIDRILYMYPLAKLAEPAKSLQLKAKSERPGINKRCKCVQRSKARAYNAYLVFNRSWSTLSTWRPTDGSCGLIIKWDIHCHCRDLKIQMEQDNTDNYECGVRTNLLVFKAGGWQLTKLVDGWANKPRVTGRNKRDDGTNFTFAVTQRLVI